MSLIRKKSRRDAPNVLKYDPTQTGPLRRAFMKQLESKFKELDKKVWRLIVGENAFGLAVNFNPLQKRDNHGQWVKSGANSWMGDSIGLQLHFDDILKGVAAGPGKARIEAEELLHAIRGGALNKKTLYRGALEQPSGVQSWTESRSVAEAWAKKSGGKVYVLPALTVKTLPLKGLIPNDVEKQHIVELPIQTVNAWFAFDSSAEQVKKFQEWLQAQLTELFYPAAEDSFWIEYIRKGWQQGADKVYRAWRTPSEFLRSSFNVPVAVNKVKLLAGRVLTELTGLTTDMATKMSRALVDGLIAGKSPREVARDITKSVEVSRARAMTIARTETVRAHAEGQLDTLRGLGMGQVGVAVEWSVSGVGTTAKGNPSPCKVCAPMAHVVFTLEEATGLIPRHPNCMCSFIPANVGEDGSAQLRSFKAVSTALKKSLKAERPKASKSKLARQSSWAGAKVKLDKKRPTSIFNSNPNHDQRGKFARSPGDFKTWEDHVSDFHRAFDEVEDRNLPGYARLSELRRALPHHHPVVFDHIVGQLRKEGHIGLSILEGRNVSKEHVDGAVTIDGVQYGLAMRKRRI